MSAQLALLILTNLFGVTRVGIICALVLVFYCVGWLSGWFERRRAPELGGGDLYRSKKGGMFSGLFSAKKSHKF